MKNPFKKWIKAQAAAANISAARAEFARRLLLTCLILTVTSLASLAYMSKAWFANNTNVSADNNSVMTESATASLFIQAGAELSGERGYAMAVISEQGNAELFPISTADCETWYYASGWTKINGKGYASSFTAAEVGADGTYTNSFEGRTGIGAYYKAQFNIYTNKSTMDVYLAPWETSSPIAVTYNATGGKVLNEAIRVALVDENGDIIFVYAPAAEDGKGNSMDTNAVTQADDHYYCISGGDLATVSGGNPYILYAGNGLSDYTAAQDEDTDGAYVTKENSKKICRTDTNGCVLTVYVWLEGTDAQTVLGSTDDESSGLSVKLRLAGVLVPDNE